MFRVESSLLVIIADWFKRIHHGHVSAKIVSYTSNDNP